MRARLLPAALSAALALGACAQTSTAPPVQVGSGSPPVLDAITMKTVSEGGFPVVIPQFHFHDADGDVRFLARELVSSNGPYDKTQGSPVNDPAALQQRGAIFAGRWRCGANIYYATMRAYLIDQAGNRSNAMNYTIHCTGG